MIPDEENYLKLLSFPRTQRISKTEIAAEIENFIPESALEKNIYWEIIGENEGEMVVSARVIKEEYMKKITAYLKKTKVKLGRVFFESDIIAKSRTDTDLPEIVINNKEVGVLILVVFKEKVWQSILINKNEETEIIDQIKRDFENKWKIELIKIEEENDDVFEMLQDNLMGESNYIKTINFLLIATIVIGLVVLIVFIPMILKNIGQTQNNLIEIRQINK